MPLPPVARSVTPRLICAELLLLSPSRTGPRSPIPGTSLSCCAIHGYRGHSVVEAAVKLAPLVFVRPGELRAAEWTEIDLEASEWRIAAHRTKMRRPHLVPLSRQARAVLREIQPLTGRGRYVFPSPRTQQRPLSDNAVTAALRRMGYTGERMSWHGFRAMACLALERAHRKCASERAVAA
jgi:integrase